jgi:iron complex transport system substrate-binding protein
MAPGNWMPELVEMAAGENLSWSTWEDLEAGDPDTILVMPCGFDLERAASEMHWLTRRPGWRNLQAVRNHRVFVTDGNQYFNRPGPRLVESLEILAAVLHSRTGLPANLRPCVEAQVRAVR